MDAFRVIKRPHNSEKSHEYAQDQNTYVFEVDLQATKTDIKQAIELLWSVKVKSVRTTIMPTKQRRFGRKVGCTSPWKKAMVRLAEGQAIDALR